MCGIVGLYHAGDSDEVACDILEGLSQLQHRGQDGCGVVTTSPRGYCHYDRGLGLVTDVFGEGKSLDFLSGSVGLGHVRYRTAGSLSSSEAQPLRATGRREVYLVHNGHVSVAKDADGQCRLFDPKDTTGSSDSHAILGALVQGMERKAVAQENTVAVVLAGLRNVYDVCRGSFACIAMINSAVMVGFRDPYGIKPLVFGVRLTSSGSMDYMFGSESVALEKLGFTTAQDVRPGEAVFLDVTAAPPCAVRKQVIPPLAYAPDIFEYVYFARPESRIDGISVHECRQRMGKALALTVREEFGTSVQDFDVVVPVPETAYVSSLALAQALKVPFAFGLTKNRYSPRSFIVPGCKERLKAVNRKFGSIESHFKDKNVLIVDDSIVRGGTSREIVTMAREAGAARVVFASASPAIRFNHIYGIDIADPKQLIASGRTNGQVAEAIGADAVVYLPIERLIDCCLQSRVGRHVRDFEVGLFTGKYVGDTTVPLLPPVVKQSVNLAGSYIAVKS